eukprot:TRINITY_DN689_c1_g2_i1.p1 TRINITY_DN689_c1_g2~~TRINITY_DN689_c1_g2_i1.p1  ORF type:complete len:611 (+),score=170.69 TRINITY_DN689_c1_g2_i1:46-1833(+)
MESTKPWTVLAHRTSRYNPESNRNNSNNNNEDSYDSNDDLDSELVDKPIISVSNSSENYKIDENEKKMKRNSSSSKNLSAIFGEEEQNIRGKKNLSPVDQVSKRKRKLSINFGSSPKPGKTNKKKKKSGLAMSQDVIDVTNNKNNNNNNNNEENPVTEEEQAEIYISEYDLTQVWGVPDCNSTIIVEDKTKPFDVKAATCSKLIERLTLSELDHVSHEGYLKVFFMTYRSFVDSRTLFKKLEERYMGPPDIPIEQQIEDESVCKVKNSVCRVLVFWFNNHFRDFGTDNELTKSLKQFIIKIKEIPQHKDNLTNYLDKMVEKKLGKGTYKSIFESMVMDNPPTPVLPKDWNTSFLDLDELEIARQLTISESHLYAEIKPEELQDLAWSKAKLKHRAPNVLGMIDKFNQYSVKFSTLIVSIPKIKQRRKVVEKFIRIAEHLMGMNSFNMVMAIMSGFGNSAIYRLKHTFGSLSKKAMESSSRIQDQLSQNQSYKTYRELLSTVSPPCIPFLGVYLTDLTFVEEGNTDKINDLINFKKRQLEYDVIVQVLKYQSATYNLKMVPRFLNIIKRMKSLDEKSMYQLSLQIEPRNSKKKDVK